MRASSASAPRAKGLVGHGRRRRSVHVGEREGERGRECAVVWLWVQRVRCTACGKTVHNTRILKGEARAGQAQAATNVGAGGQLATTFAGDGGAARSGATGAGMCACTSPRPDAPLVVGVGESVGSVYPLLGEGIIPSMECVNLFVDHMDDLGAYQSAVIRHFELYGKVYRFIKSKMDGNFSVLRQFPELWSIYRHMKTNERRYGLETHLGDILKVINV